MKFVFLSLLVCASLVAQEPDRSKRTLPQLDIKSAIDLAASYVASPEAPRLRNRFLASVRYIDYGNRTEYNPVHKTKGPYWQVTYEVDHLASGGELFVFVYMDGKVYSAPGL